MTVFVLGAGPAGLAVVDGLVDSGAGPFTLIERGDGIGGLAQTIDWPEVGSHDLGPHKIFTLDEALMTRVEALLPASDWLTRDKISSIYMRGHYLPYPPSPFSLAGVFGLPTFARMVAGYGAARLRSLAGSEAPNTFEADLVERLGRPLYEALFRPIALKLWGDPRNLDLKLSKGRVQTPSLTEVLTRLLKLKSSSEFEALSFRYPRHGLSRIWEAIKTKAAHSGEINTGLTVTGFEVEKRAVRAIRTRHAKDGSERVFSVTTDDFVASTLPLSLVVDLLSPALPADIPALARETVALNDLLLVFLHIDQPALMKDSWVFVPDPEIGFHRLSEQKAFDPRMTPNGSVVCCEIMSSDIRPMATRKDGELIEQAVIDLGKMGYAGFNVRASKVIRLPKSYPVYKVGYERGLVRIMAELDQIGNLRTVGRQGSFNYVGTLDAMDIGYGFARWYAGDRADAWEAERARTNHYPVLD
jgi:protoporphyrinogen oxidase